MEPLFGFLRYSIRQISIEPKHRTIEDFSDKFILNKGLYKILYSPLCLISANILNEGDRY